MSTALDLASLAAQGELKIPIARGVVSQGGSGTDYTGWSGVSSVFVEAKVEVREQSRGFATLTLTVEGSSNGSDWSTLETFNFGHGGTQSATVSSPPDHLRVSWTVGGGSEWQIIEVTAAPSVIDFTTDGGSQFLTKSLHLSPAQILALDSAPVTAVAAPGVGKVLFTPNAGGYAVFRAGVTPYTLSTFSLYVGAGASSVGSITSPLILGLSGLLDSAVDAFGSLEIAGASGAPLSLSENQPIQVAAATGIGDGDGTLDLFFYYVVIDLP